MSLPFLPVYTLSKEEKIRLDGDAVYLGQALERLLGAQNPSTGRGWTQWNCPSETCAGKNDFKLGVSLDGPTFSAYRCLRCGLKGRGFASICRQLYHDPGSYVDSSAVYVAPEPRPKVVAVREHPLADKEFARFWRWIAERSKEAYGPTGLMPEHRANLEKRALDIDRLPFYFSMPPAEVLERALVRHGENVCDKAGIWDSEKQSRRLFFEPGRMAIVYPAVPWLDRDVPFGYLRSYNPDCKTKTDKKFKLIGALGYHSNRNCYVRADPFGKPQPLLVGEAEIKAECAWQAGTNSIGRPGINSAHEEVARIVVKMLELSEGKNPTRILLCDDTEADDAHQQNVELNIHALASTIREIVLKDYHGYKIKINRVCLPADAGHKRDIDDFIGSLTARYGLEAGRVHWLRWLYTEAKNQGPFEIKTRAELESGRNCGEDSKA